MRYYRNSHKYTLFVSFRFLPLFGELRVKSYKSNSNPIALIRLWPLALHLKGNQNGIKANVVPKYKFSYVNNKYIM